MPPPQFQVHLSGAVKDQLREVVSRAVARGQREDVLRAVRKISEGLTWIADELGESRHPLKALGELRVVVIGPVGAVFAVDRAQLAVQVGRFRLMGVRRTT